MSIGWAAIGTQSGGGEAGGVAPAGDAGAGSDPAEPPEDVPPALPLDVPPALPDDVPPALPDDVPPTLPVGPPPLSEAGPEEASAEDGPPAEEPSDDGFLRGRQSYQTADFFAGFTDQYRYRAATSPYGRFGPATLDCTLPRSSSRTVV